VAVLLRPELERQGVSVVVDPGSVWPALRVDSEQVQQLLLNVLLNAVQASPRGSTVRVSSRAEPRFLAIDVADEGPGIPEAHLAQVLDPFFTTKPHGTGLGLAVSARIVSAHQGSIDIRRNRERGTTVCVRLPLPEDALAGADTPVERSGP
jgi:two-component system sensor histidine kinase AtoS